MRPRWRRPVLRKQQNPACDSNAKAVRPSPAGSPGRRGPHRPCSAPALLVHRILAGFSESPPPEHPSLWTDGGFAPGAKPGPQPCPGLRRPALLGFPRPRASGLGSSASSCPRSLAVPLPPPAPCALSGDHAGGSGKTPAFRLRTHRRERSSAHSSSLCARPRPDPRLHVPALRGPGHRETQAQGTLPLTGLEEAGERSPTAGGERGKSPSSAPASPESLCAGPLPSQPCEAAEACGELRVPRPRPHQRSASHLPCAGMSVLDLWNLHRDGDGKNPASNS